MKILKANKQIPHYKTLAFKVDSLNYGHCAIDAPGYEKLVKRIDEYGMVWPLVIVGNTIKFGNKRLLYARVNGYDYIECVKEEDTNKQNELGDMTRIK